MVFSPTLNQLAERRDQLDACRDALVKTREEAYGFSHYKAIRMATPLEIRADFVELAKTYAGQWVAIDPDTHRVVASGSTAMQAFELAKRAGVSDPIITGVSADYGAYVPCLTV